MKTNITPKWVPSSLVLSILIWALTPISVFATTVQFQTSLGNFEVNLYDESTPITVANFLSYVNDSSYSDSIVHRSVSNFVIQGGGFGLNDEGLISSIPNEGTIENEPVFSNVRGTISMARLGGQVNSATTQWFINLSDNSASLDSSDGGFAVFGEVVGDGMQIVDAIASVPIFNAGGAFSELPLQNYTDTSAPIEEDNYVKVDAIVILDGAVDTARDLNPTLNTLKDQRGGGGGGGGGSIGFWFLVCLFACGLVRKHVT